MEKNLFILNSLSSDKIKKLSELVVKQIRMGDPMCPIEIDPSYRSVQVAQQLYLRNLQNAQGKNWDLEIQNRIDLTEETKDILMQQLDEEYKITKSEIYDF